MARWILTNIVVDANFSLAQVLPLPYSQDVLRHMNVWRTELPRLLVPSLWEYEVVTGLRRAYVQGLLTREEMKFTLDELLAMALEVAPGSSERHHRALVWAERLGQARAYDAQYLALAELFEAEFWTGDRRLANAAHQLGLTWVRWVGEE